MLELFKQAEFVVFTTRDFANANQLSLSAASNRLRRLVEESFLTRITRGVWANEVHPHFQPLACVPYLLGKEQGYVSFLTALHLHNVISQIPGAIQVATTGRPRVINSPVGRFEFLRIKPELMRGGVEWSATHQPYLMATGEKALFARRSNPLSVKSSSGRIRAALEQLGTSGTNPLGNAGTLAKAGR